MCKESLNDLANDRESSATRVRQKVFLLSLRYSFPLFFSPSLPSSLRNHSWTWHLNQVLLNGQTNENLQKIIWSIAGSSLESDIKHPKCGTEGPGSPTDELCRLKQKGRAFNKHEDSNRTHKSCHVWWRTKWYAYYKPHYVVCMSRNSSAKCTRQLCFIDRINEDKLSLIYYLLCGKVSTQLGHGPA